MVNAEPTSAAKERGPSTSKFQNVKTVAPENFFSNSSREEMSPKIDLKKSDPLKVEE